MSRADFCDIVVVLDRSGSMASIRAEMEGGFDTFVAEQRKVPGDCVLTLVQFDLDATEVVYAGKLLADVPGLSLVPRGLTPLLDAVGTAVTKAQERISALPDDQQPGKVLVVIITDGQENSSREWTKEKVQKLVADRRAAGWEFVFLGLGIDAFAEAGAMGIPSVSTSSQPSTPQGVQKSYFAASASATSYRTGGSAQIGPKLVEDDDKGA